jgi:hypothetical protein
VRRRKREGKRFGDLRHRNGFGLRGDVANDGKCPIERSIAFGLLSHSRLRRFSIIRNYHFSELKQSKYEKIIERPTGMLIELALPASE